MLYAFSLLLLLLLSLLLLRITATAVPSQHIFNNSHKYYSPGNCQIDNPVCAWELTQDPKYLPLIPPYLLPGLVRRAAMRMNKDGLQRLLEFRRDFSLLLQGPYRCHLRVNNRAQIAWLQSVYPELGKINIYVNISVDVNLLTSAVRARQPQTIVDLIEAGVDINAADDNEETALYTAATRDLEIAKILLDAGAIVDEPGDSNDYSAVIIAALLSHADFVRFFVSYGADVNAVNGYGYTALMVTALNPKYGEENAEILIEAGANLDMVDSSDGASALMWAVDYKRVSIVKLLIKAGADFRLVNKKGKTALAMAKESGCKQIVQLLEDAGAVY